jgi:hypothetical protein
MKVLVVFEYHEKLPNFSLTAIDSQRTAYAGNLLISGFEITKYCDIFYVRDREDMQKFKNGGLKMDDFLPVGLDSIENVVTFSTKMIDKILDWAMAKRMWVYRGQKLTGPEREKFEKFYSKLEWQKGE